VIVGVNVRDGTEVTVAVTFSGTSIGDIHEGKNNRRRKNNLFFMWITSSISQE